jgi:hypothetical protein
MEIDKKAIEAAIVDRVANDIIGDEYLWARVKTTIDKRIEALWTETVEGKIAEEVNRCVNEGFEREYQKIDSFGGPIGEKTTIRKELERLISEYWVQRVDRKGKPTKDSYNATTRAEWMMTMLVADDFSSGMKQHIVNVGGALKDGLRAELHSTVNKLMSDVFNVNSQGDREAKESGSAIIHPKTK